MRTWLYPAGVERDYLRGINRIAVVPLEDACRRILIPALSDIRMDVDIRDIPETTGWYEQLRQALVATLAAATIPEPIIRALVSRVFTETNEFNAKEWRAILRSVYRVDIITGAPPALRDALVQFEAENIALIKSIPQQALSRMQGRIVAAVSKGETLASTTKYVREEFGVARNRAELIARDQIGKLNGQLTEMRQRDLGVDEYTWRGILDARERPEHVAREGEVYAWAKPPEDGHPGQPIRCRCTAEPRLPSWEEMERRILADRGALVVS